MNDLKLPYAREIQTTFLIKWLADLPVYFLHPNRQSEQKTPMSKYQNRCF